MELPRPSIHGNRPAYLDKLFHDAPPPLPPPPRTSSLGLRSTKSSISSLNSELEANEVPPRQLKLKPSFDTASIDDRISVRSLRLHLSPRFQIRNILNRRTPSEVQETIQLDEIRPSTSHASSPSTKLPSPLRPQTPFTSHKRRAGYWSSSKSLPVTTSPCKTQELHCTPCYYFTARNCNGYVFGGAHGDACENCSALGFLGAP